MQRQEVRTPVLEGALRDSFVLSQHIKPAAKKAGVFRNTATQIGQNVLARHGGGNCS